MRLRRRGSVDATDTPGTAGPEGQSVPPARSASKALLIYNAARLGLLAICLGLGAVAGLRGFVLLIAALAVSGVLSWFLLSSQRIKASVAVEQTVGQSRTAVKVSAPVRRKRASIRARVAAEDAYVDELQRQQELDAQRRAAVDADASR